MNIKKISKEAQTLISASAYVNNFTRAIEELVFNSLDAECTSIAIRVSIQESFIQILDNGIGINKENFCLLGQKYATSKHIDVTALKSAPDKYGFCGLSLASIIEISQDVLISSRYHERGGTWLKAFHNGTQNKLCIAPERPSKGTTIEIRGFLYNLNIQRKSINTVHELQNIKSSLEQLSLIHCNVSISLRDDYKNEIIFKIHKKRDIYQTLWSLFDITREDVQELQVEKNQYKLKAFISKGEKVKQNQWIYLNGKFVTKTQIHKKINKILNKLIFKHKKITKMKKNNNDVYYKSDLPFYFIFISCPFCDFDITYKNKQILVEFKDWTEIDKLIEKLVQFYCGEGNFKIIEEKKSKIENTRIQVKEIIEKILNNNVKQPSIQHGIKGKNIKRKNKKNNTQTHNDIPLKSQTPINNFKVLNLKKKKEVQNTLLNIKKKYDAKKEIMNPHVKDINKIKYRNKTSSKQMKKIRNVDSLVNRFKNQTDSVRKRCAKLSSEAEHLMNLATPKKKIIKLTYTAEYNETVSYCTNKQVRDTNIVVTDTKSPDDNFRNDNIDFVKPKTSYDLIKPFNQNDSECSTIPEHTQIYSIQSSPRVVNSESCKSLHKKNTFDSHNYHNNSERKKNLKHFISSRQNFFLQNKNCTILHENVHKTKKSLFNETYLRNCVNMKQVFYKIKENRSDLTTEVNNTYAHNYEDCDNKFDKINNISDLHDKKAITNFGKTYDIRDCSAENKNAPNKTYSVHLSNNLSAYSSNKLSTVDKEPILIEQNIKHVQSNIKSTIISESPSNIKYLLSGSIDPLNYCETIFKRNEIGDITKQLINSFTSNRENNYSFDYELLDDGNNEILKETVLKNTQDKECGIKDINLRSNDIDLTKSKILTQNNFPQDVNCFQLKKRHEFMPKGMSQNYKTRIRKYHDISSTKIDYYENAVYNNFADDVLVNFEIFSPTLQNVDVKSKMFEKTNHRDDSNLIFNASSIKEAKVFGQIDRKFIATQIKGISSDSSLDFLVLFDQHAVDERIRLETNLADYFDGNMWSSVALDSIPLKLDKHDLLHVYNHKLKFIQFGLQLVFLDDRILVNSIPKAILGKTPRQEDVVLKAARRLILEEIDVIKSHGGNVSLYPKAIMDLVFSEACRYAIKFGDKLSNCDCVTMLEMLATCKTPFQCAHGRPVMAVLIDLPRNIRNYEVNVENIKQFKLSKCM